MTTPPLIRSNSGSGWWFCGHARRRATERGITGAEMLAVLRDPQVTYTQNTYGPDRQILQRGELGLVVHPPTRTVITVIYRHPARWKEHLSGHPSNADPRGPARSRRILAPTPEPKSWRRRCGC
jgi:hypothetical protein